ncbi:MAG: sigma-70 family RNA polymerase sigma factor [Clostridia bacterium]|nr:sigma-70 family RNA polymerase sigma factor [Clostridia bacterium]
MKNINKKELHQLFSGLINKDDIKFNEFYSKYNKLIYCIAFSILKNEEESKDITQKVFIKIWNLEKSKFPTKNEASWLYILTKNETLMYLRNKKQELNIEDMYYIGKEDKELNEIIDKDKYNRILSKLDIKDQEIVSLKILSQFSFNQISKILDMPIGTVQWRYYKAINTLKSLITNISMFIIVITIYLNRKTFIRKENNEKLEDNNNTSSVREIDTTQTATKEEKTTQEESTIQNSASQDLASINTNTISEESEIQNVTVKEDRENITSNPKSYIDISLMVLSCIFLVFSVIFLKNFINHQQNKRKKASK